MQKQEASNYKRKKTGNRKEEEGRKKIGRRIKLNISTKMGKGERTI